MLINNNCDWCFSKHHKSYQCKIKNKITDNNIKSLKPNEIFVFGSNYAGRHGRGAAKTALKFGAKYGQGYGLQGQTFGICTKDRKLKVLSLDKIQNQVNKFIKYAKNSNYIFLVTEIGCGLAGYKAKDIAPMFIEAKNIENIHLPLNFWRIINE